MYHKENRGGSSYPFSTSRRRHFLSPKYSVFYRLGRGAISLRTLYRVFQKELYNLPVSCIWTCSKSSSFHSWTKMTKKDAFTSPHYLGEVREYLNTRFPGRWIGRAAPIAWPPRSPDLTPMDLFLWGFVKNQVFVPPLPANVVELRTRITAAVAKVTPEMLRCKALFETPCIVVLDVPTLLFNLFY